VAGIPFRIDPLIVRGLDYYNRTVFEIVPLADERAQSTLGGGGRYDGLMETLGGPHTPGVGFGSGMERMILEMERCEVAVEARAPIDVFIVVAGAIAQGAAFALAGDLRELGLSVILGEAGRSMRAQLRAANSSGARAAAILGEDEVKSGTVTVRPLQTEAEQSTLPMGAPTLAAILALTPRPETVSSR
jgi:histidyl-tRNA synthetase